MILPLAAIEPPAAAGAARTRPRARAAPRGRLPTQHHYMASQWGAVVRLLSLSGAVRSSYALLPLTTPTWVMQQSIITQP